MTTTRKPTYEELEELAAVAIGIVGTVEALGKHQAGSPKWVEAFENMEAGLLACRSHVQRLLRDLGPDGTQVFKASQSEALYRAEKRRLS